MFWTRRRSSWVNASFEALLRKAPQDEEGSGIKKNPHPEVLAQRASKDALPLVRVEIDKE
jgi:hypothetical protein